MLTKLLVFLIVGVLLWMAIKEQIGRLSNRPSVRALRDLAERARQAEEQARRSSGRRSSEPSRGRAGRGDSDDAVRLVACERCRVHTPEHLLRRRDGRNLCRACEETE